MKTQSSSIQKQYSRQTSLHECACPTDPSPLAWALSCSPIISTFITTLSTQWTLALQVTVKFVYCFESTNCPCRGPPSRAWRRVRGPFSTSRPCPPLIVPVYPVALGGAVVVVVMVVLSPCLAVAVVWTSILKSCVSNKKIKWKINK